VSQLILSNRREGGARKKRTIVAYSHPESILSEQFRMIYTNINFLLSDQKNNQTFIVTSPIDGEGKSTVITNLAVSMAQQKKKVLLIDANLRNPVLHSFFNISNKEGLTDVLTGRKSFYEVIYHTEVWRLDLLPSGHIPYNPVELLGSQGMKDLLQKAKESYDFILIDSTSIIDVPDTKLLANLSDGVLLVLQNGKTNQGKVVEAKKVIEFAKAKLVGVILNQ
jgi:capsular exopolysaccharide synthesis family protein